MSNQLGCQHCGVVLHRRDANAETRGGQLVYACPECGDPMQPIGLREALDLAEQRAEAERWRAARDPQAGHGFSRSGAAPLSRGASPT
jgi:NAD-dependent SIR2 family protein deacetylase